MRVLLGFDDEGHAFVLFFIAAAGLADRTIAAVAAATTFVAIDLALDTCTIVITGTIDGQGVIRALIGRAIGWRRVGADAVCVGAGRGIPRVLLGGGVAETVGNISHAGDRNEACNDHGHPLGGRFVAVVYANMFCPGKHKARA